MPINPGSFYCAVCKSQVLFSEFVRDSQGAIKVLCNDCTETHFITVEPIDPGPTAEKES
jgi:hypothetical protein